MYKALGLTPLKCTAENVVRALSAPRALPLDLFSRESAPGAFGLPLRVLIPIGFVCGSASDFVSAFVKDIASGFATFAEARSGIRPHRRSCAPARTGWRPLKQGMVTQLCESWAEDVASLENGNIPCVVGDDGRMWSRT